ncbi:hypothetical protein PAMA_003055 [Pampus argenteus]
MASELSESVRSQIVILSKEGLSQRQIMARLKVSKGAVHGTLKRAAETGSVVSKARSGRPKVTTPAEDQYIQLSSLRDRRVTSSQIQYLLNKERVTPISKSTVKRRLSCSCLRRRAAVSKPLLRRGNKAKRLGWAKKYQHFTVDDWKKVLFTDETSISQSITPTVKHGGENIQVWGCFAYSGVGHLHRIDYSLTKEEYHSILERHVIPSGLHLCGEGFILQQDNDPKHISKLCKNYLKTKVDQRVLTVMDFPLQSPDLNPIEHLWGHLKTEKAKHSVTSREALWNIIKSCWDNVCHQVLHKLVESMPARVHAVIKAKGGQIKS